MSALEVISLVVGILLFVALGLSLTLTLVRRRAHRLRAEMQAELGDGVLRMDNVNGFGLLSAGKAQVRGNGWLALTDDELAFTMWVPRRETRIPLSEITAVETPRSWLGKTVGAKLLCVRWRTPAGEEDAMAWQVPDLEGWLSAVGAGNPAVGRP